MHSVVAAVVPSLRDASAQHQELQSTEHCNRSRQQPFNEALMLAPDCLRSVSWKNESAKLKWARCAVWTFSTCFTHRSPARRGINMDTYTGTQVHNINTAGFFCLFVGDRCRGSGERCRNSTRKKRVRKGGRERRRNKRETNREEMERERETEGMCWETCPSMPTACDSSLRAQSTAGQCVCV